MTLQQLKEIALKATQIEFQTHHDNSTVSVKWCSPEIILALLNAVEAFKKISKHLGEFEYEEVEGPLDALDKAMGGEK
jgi:hypothetical protein